MKTTYRRKHLLGLPSQRARMQALHGREHSINRADMRAKVSSTKHKACMMGVGEL